MKLTFCLLLSVIFYSGTPAQEHKPVIDKIKFFDTDTALDATLIMDIGKFVRSHASPKYFAATFSCKTGDSILSEEVRVIARGNVRREICYMPPIKMDFHNSTSPALYPLNSLKLVNACNQDNYNDQLLLKEYIIYKIYNLLTDKSFRVRLLNLKYENTGNKKSVLEHAFFIEDAKDMAKRNGCKALKDVKLLTEATNRSQMTLVAIFEYMIGNTDWGVPVNHNTILIRSSEDSTMIPLVVPYDFDYSGLVNAEYAVPSDGLGLESVRDRLYRGFARTMDEIDSTLLIFKTQQENIYTLIKNFDLLSNNNKKEMLGYLNKFYEIISDEKEAKRVFVDGARTR